jgi:hypothetical protein
MRAEKLLDSIHVFLGVTVRIGCGFQGCDVL